MPEWPGPPPVHAEVVVIGGGIAGTAAAYHLSREGIQVALLERGRLGGGTTARGVGVFSPPMRQPFHETVRFRGEAVAREIWQFAERSVRGLADLLAARGAADACELDMSGGLILAERHTESEVRSSFAALRRAGFAVEWLGVDVVRERTGSGAFTGALRLAVGGAVEPVVAAYTLARAAVEAGTRIAEDIEVSGVASTDAGLVCRTAQGEVACEMVVYATHVDSRRFSSFLGDEIVPVRWQAFRTGPVATRFRGAFATGRRQNYWRQAADGSLEIAGWRYDSWERSYYQPRPALDERLQSDLRGWFEAAFPALAPLQVERRWSGILGWTADYLPLVGPLPGRPRELVIGGFSGGGLCFAFEAGRIIARTVKGGESVPGTELFNPRRFA
ncbi:MAG: FAD-binding oxidoreductase [Gemmatimonadetes bacterium]|nr:FAD-binding oxidoreductase [Gemmatimonadota bacterium]